MTHMHYYTPDELYDVYEFKLLKKLLKREFPFIKDVFVIQEDLEKYNIIFLDFDYDPIEFARMYNDEIKPKFLKMIEDGKYLDLSYPHLLGDMTYDEFTNVRENINKSIKKVMKNDAIPNELKIHRPVGIGTWHVNRGGEPYLVF
jgi:hypothetical protein